MIPAYREEVRLPDSLAKISLFLAAEPGLAGAEVIVVDDHSTDGTGEIARRIMLEVTLTGVRTFCVRVWLGKQLIRLAVWVMGIGMLDVKDDEKETP